MAGGREPMISDDEILDVFRESEHRFLGTSEVAKELGFSVQGTSKRLDSLAESGDLSHRQIGGTSIYWLPYDD